MRIFRGFLSSSLRFKILFGLLLSIVPMLAIVGLSYHSARNAALQNSDRMIQLMARNGAREINGWLMSQQGAFQDWTKEDVFGMAIEFQTTKELLSQFQLWLKGQEAFSLLLLTDKDGKVLEAAVAEHAKSANPDGFVGRTIKEAGGFMNKAGREAALVQSDFIKQLGQTSGYTYLFCFRAKDTEGRPNGLFLAYMNWNHLQAKVNAVSDEMKTNGFKNAKVAILNTASGVALAHSNATMIDARLEMANSMRSWLKTGRGGEVRVFDFGKEADYVSFFPVQSSSELFEKDDPTAKDSGLAMTAFVPENDIMADVQRILWTSAAVGGGGGILIVLIGILIVGLISKPLNRAIEGLTEGADQVAAASELVASSSHLLAEGASEQAASLEESSSSLEEMASMTKQNADNANKANGLMKQANEVVGKANASMVELTTSMEEIAKASEETSKIIKTIDEIAFQTNLLALNAAVEAARAGEAGAGFAVVADEVRNLAMRAADAANNTANLIEGTVKKVKDGSELVKRTNKAFTEMAASAAEVGELVGEITAASQDQAKGIEQVNTAVAEMDKATQQTAGNAEESASAAEEMNAQAQQMKNMVEVLASVVGGSGKSVGKRKAVRPKRSGSQKAKILAHGNRNLKREALAVPAPREVSANDIIPMDDEDFKDF